MGFRAEEDKIRLRINKAIYSYPQHIVEAYEAWMDYSIFLEGMGNFAWADLAQKIGEGYTARAACLNPKSNGWK